MDDTCDQPARSQTGSAAASPHRPRPDLPDTQAAPIDLQVIEAILADNFGIVGAALQQLPGEVDRNVKVTARDGRTLVLKVSPRSVDVSRIAWQEALLRRVSEAGLKLAVPTVVPSLSGSSFATVPIDGQPSAARLLTWVPGLMLADLPEHPVPLLEDLGHIAALLTDALAHVAEPNLQHTHLWDLCNADAAVESAIDRVHDRAQRRDIERIMRWFGFIKPALAALPHGVVHQDLNDFNVLASPIGRDYRISGVVDFADALHTVRVAEVAIASAYAMLRKEDPLSAMSAVVRGFNAVIPLTNDELSVLFPLAAARLCVNATVWTQRLSEHARDYAKQRVRNTWPTLARIAQIEPAYAEAVLRAECGHPASPNVDRIARWLTAVRTDRRAGLSRVLPSDLRVVELDLGVDSDLFDTVGGAYDFDWASADTIARERFTAGSGAMKPAWYVPPFRPSLIGTAMRGSGDHEPATVPLGGRLIARHGTQLRLPCAGLVEEIHQPGTLALRHEVIDCDGRELTFWSCWSGVDSDHEPGAMLQSGQPIASIAAPRDGQSIAPLGTAWIKLSSTRLGLVEPAPDHVPPSRAAVWASLSPDPSQFLGLPVVPRPPSRDDRTAMHLRELHFGRSQRTYYRRPMRLVRGRGTWLYDEHGFAYLDSVNNVTHVGHAERRVNAAAIRQLNKLNTNSRFLYDGIASYADRLTATLPKPLEVVFLVCTGSEANDLAVRMARQVSGRSDVIVIDGAYHGNTTAVTGISPHRYKGAGGAGAPPTTHEVMAPDRYRGRYNYDDSDAGARYVVDVVRVTTELVARGTPPAAMIAESLMGTAGCIVLPDGYLTGAFQAVRAAGGLCISDEVQVGLGRLGDAFWGFETQGVVPDIVTMGKPLGNGFPIAAVVTTREIADAFDNGMKYFNTFGGNPVACAVGLAVLDVVRDDGLQSEAKDVGEYFMNSLLELQRHHQIIGDIRGRGLYLGIDLVSDRISRHPATARAMQISEQMKDIGVITYAAGTADNVLKVKPPMVFQRRHVDLFVDRLDGVLRSCVDDH